MKKFLFTSAVALAIIFNFCELSKAEPPKPTVVVEMTSELKFAPSLVKIKKGDTVEWKNVATFPHTVTSDPTKAVNPKDVELPKGAKTFSSGNIQPGKSFIHTFNVPGKYRYFCIPHETAGMLGEVDVSP